MQQAIRPMPRQSKGMVNNPPPEGLSFTGAGLGGGEISSGSSVSMDSDGATSVGATINASGDTTGFRSRIDFRQLE